MNEKMECFTDAELLILSDGILALVANAEEALRLVKDKGIQAMLSQKMQEYSDLEAKVCMMMGNFKSMMMGNFKRAT